MLALKHFPPKTNLVKLEEKGETYKQLSIYQGHKKIFLGGGQKKGMDPLLVTQGVGLGGANSPSRPAGGELFTLYVLREKDRNNLHVRAIAK